MATETYSGVVCRLEAAVVVAVRHLENKHCLLISNDEHTVFIKKHLKQSFLKRST